MRNGLYYLNNHGSRWVIYTNGKKDQIIIEPDKYSPCKETIVRTALWYESFGNYACAVYSYKGKKYKTLNYKPI